MIVSIELICIVWININIGYIETDLKNYTINGGN